MINGRGGSRGKYGFNWIAGVIILTLLLASVAFLRPEPAENIERLFLNGFVSRMKLPPIDDKLVMILGGDRSINEVGIWPWPRNTYIKLLDGPLKSARTVAFDILFADESPEGDEMLADAFRQHGNVVLCYAEAIDGKSELHSLPLFIEAASGEGFSNGFRDSDGIMRKYRFIMQKQIIVPSFVCAIAMVSGYDIDWDYGNTGAVLHVTPPSGGTYDIAADRDMQFMRFPAPVSQIEVYEMSDVLNGRIPPEEFEGAIVVLGFNASGAVDVVSSANGLVSGTQYNIDSLYTLISGVNPVRAPVLLDVLAVVALFLLSLFLTSKIRIHISFLPVIGLVGLWLLAVNVLFFNNMIWLSGFVPIIAVLLGYAYAIIIALIRSQRDLRVRSLSMDSLLGLSRSLGEAAKFEAFTEYLNMLAEEIRAATEIEIIDPMLDKHQYDLSRFNMSEKNDGLRIAYNSGSPPLIHEILISLPLLDGDDGKQYYTLLGMRSRMATATIRSVATLIVTAYVYFYASKAAAARSDMFYALIQCMISAMDAKDPITSGHSQRVAEVSEKIGRWMNLPEQEVAQLKFSGMIHDIGKIGIPDSVLNKPGLFSGADFKLMQQHPLKGGAIMSPISLGPEILDGVLYHHERIDGKGYPYGKKGGELTLVPRIIKVADVYDALCSKRQYKKAWPLERVLNTLYEGRGTEFDSDIVDLLIENVKPEGWQPPFQCFSPSDEPNAFVLNEYRCVIQSVKEAVRDAKLFELGALLGRYDGAEDFDCRDSFYSINWHEGYTGESFLHMRPQLLRAESDIIIFSLAFREKPVSHVLYYFFRGFLAAGALICAEGSVPPLAGPFGDPSYSDNEITLWDKGRMAVILVKETPEFPPAIFYITKSVLDK